MSRQDRDRNSKKEKSEFDEKVLFVNRCTKVLKGGRKFSFSALILVGDRKGKVGFGFAKANELSEAIKKGGELARKDLRTFERDGTSIPHEVVVDWDGARVLLKPAPAGTGVIAGSRIRAVLEIAGVKDIVAKSLGSNNPINQVRATFMALGQLKNREKTLALRRA